MNVAPDLDRSSSSSPEAYQCCITRSQDPRSDNSGFKESLKSLKYTSPILDSILKLQGGNDDLTDEEMEKLINSVLAKVPQSSYEETSINKLFKRVLKIIEPLISDQRFWRILSESQKPIKSQLPDPSEVGSTDILAPAENGQDNRPKTRRKSSFIFVQGLVEPQPRRNHGLLPPIGKTRLNMAQTSTEDSFSKGLTPKGLSVNHETFSENIQNIEIRTRLRRAEPRYSSEALGESYEYGQKQLERKARHLVDFGISIEVKSIQEMAEEYKRYVENISRRPNLVVHKNGTLNKQEPTINIEDRKSREIVAFENNSLYDKHRFISSYPISDESFEDFVQTGNIGLSPEEKKAENDKLQKRTSAS